MQRIFEFFSDAEDNNPAFLSLTRTLLTIIIIADAALMVLVSGLVGEQSREPNALTLLLFSLVTNLIALYYARKGKPRMAKIAVPLSVTLVIAFVASNDNGLRDLSVVGLPLVLIISALLLGKRSMYIATPLAILAASVIAFFDLRSDKPVESAGWSEAGILIVFIGIGAGLLQMLVRRLTETIQKLRENEQAQIEENRELDELRQSLEARVAERVSDLKTLNADSEKRMRQFQAIAQVTRAIVSVQDLDVLLPYITQVVSEQFGIYHTGIFLLDKDREYAVLRAANSEGGRQMLTNGHKLRIGQVGIIGFVAAAGQARIALDVGADAVFFNNPFLPNTRSEIGLPLKYAGQIIGALDVQSVEPNAFTQKDIEVLTTLAEQIAATISNANQLAELRAESEAYKSLSGESAREIWKVMRPRALGLGFQLEANEMRLLQEPLQGSHIQTALGGETAAVQLGDGQSTLAIPIRLRNRVIGVMQLRSSRKFSVDDTEIVEAITERLSLALETAALLEATRHRADVERVTTDISARLNSSSRIDIILQTAARELSRALGGSDVLVQIEPLSMEFSMND